MLWSSIAPSTGQRTIAGGRGAVGLPRLSHRDRATLNANISMEELTAAVGQMASGRAPGLDGLPTDLETFLEAFGC